MNSNFNFVVTKPHRHSSKASDLSLSSSPTYYYLSSIITETTGCGSPNSPWLLKVGEGQKINLTLYDFSSESLAHYDREKENLQAHNTSSIWTQSMVCRILATIKEKTTRVNALNICSGQGKVHKVYSSSTNQLQLRFNIPSAVQKPSFGGSQESKSPQPKALGSEFMFKIQGKIYNQFNRFCRSL